jgi:DNA-binding transcriptional MocR family regulator
MNGARTDRVYVCAWVRVVPAQMMKQWGAEGFHRHLQLVQAEYHRRRALTLAALARHVADVATWIVPQAGMFVWMCIPSEPDTAELVAELMDEKGYAAVASYRVSWESESRAV